MGANHGAPAVPAVAVGDQGGGIFNAAVICSADGCDHRGCQGGAFRVVFVSVESHALGEPAAAIISVWVYSSDTRSWGEPALVVHDRAVFFDKPSTLVGSSLLYFLCMMSTIVQYDMATHGLAVAGVPNELAYYHDHGSRYVLMPAEDGGLGVARAEGSFLCLWSRDVGADGDQVWIKRRTVNLNLILPDIALMASQVGNGIGLAQKVNTIYGSTVEAARIAHVIGFAEGANAIFLSTVTGIFTIDLESERARKVYDPENSDIYACRNLIPFSSFYIPGKEAAPEEEREEEPVSTLLHL